MHTQPTLNSFLITIDGSLASVVPASGVLSFRIPHLNDGLSNVHQT